MYIKKNYPTQTFLADSKRTVYYHIKTLLVVVDYKNLINMYVRTDKYAWRKWSSIDVFYQWMWKLNIECHDVS